MWANITQRKVDDGVLKNHKQFFVNVGNYWDIFLSVQIRQLFAHFWSVKFWSCDQAPPNLVCVKHWWAPTLCSNFPNFSFERQVVFELLYRWKNKFSSQKSLFLYVFFLSHNSRSCDLGSSKLAHFHYYNYYVEFKFQLLGFIVC